MSPRWNYGHIPCGGVGAGSVNTRQGASIVGNAVLGPYVTALIQRSPIKRGLSVLASSVVAQ